MKKSISLLLAALICIIAASCGKQTGGSADASPAPSPGSAAAERWRTDSDATFSAELPESEPAVSQSENIIQIGKTTGRRSTQRETHLSCHAQA